ncbi:MAG: GGDEF domain-containing protein [Nitrospira sp.]
MSSSSLKAAWHGFAPGGLVLLLAIGFLRPHGLPIWVQGPVSVFPVIVLGFGIVFGWYLSSSRLILSLLVLVFLDRGIVLFLPTDSSPGAPGPVLFAIATCLTPLNLLALSLVKEGGISTWRGILRLALVLIQPFIALWLCLPDQTNFSIPFQHALIPLSTAGWTMIPQPALLAFCVAVLLLSIRFLLYQDPLDGGTVWALAATVTAIQGLQYGWSPTNFLAAAGLTLFLSLVHASHQRTYHDELTGALGRLAFEETVARLGKRYVVAVLGMDQLKQYQRQYGKQISEQILRLVAPKILASAGTAKVFRLAGDEFTLLFYNRTATDTLATLEGIRKSAEQTRFYLRKNARVLEGDRNSTVGPNDIELPLSISTGVAEATAASPALTLVTKAAYRALYEAKGEGGNILKRGTIQPDQPKPAHNQAGRIVAYSEYDL